MGPRTPRQVRLGQTPRTGPVPPRSIFPTGALRGTERPLVHQFIGLRVLRFGFRAITVPAGTSIAASRSGWYGLRSWTVPDDIGQQSTFAGYRMSLGPTDYLGDYPIGTEVGGGGTFHGVGARWGDANGSGDGAAIVVGLSLPATVGSWSAGPVVPGCESAADNPRFTTDDADQWQVFRFAPGKPSNDPNPRIFYSQQTTPLVINLTAGARLDVAFVVERAAVNAAANKNPAFIGHCYGEILLGSTATVGEFAE